MRFLVADRSTILHYSGHRRYHSWLRCHVRRKSSMRWTKWARSATYCLVLAAPHNIRRYLGIVLVASNPSIRKMESLASLWSLRLLICNCWIRVVTLSYCAQHLAAPARTYWSILNLGSFVVSFGECCTRLNPTFLNLRTTKPQSSVVHKQRPHLLD